MWAEDPTFKHADPQITWEVDGASVLDTKAAGPKQVNRWWRDWVDAWEAYTYSDISAASRAASPSVSNNNPMTLPLRNLQTEQVGPSTATPLWRPMPAWRPST